MIFLGCDGGSTKTEWIVADETGKLLAHKIYPGCNLLLMGKEAFQKQMKLDADDLVESAGITTKDITSSMFCMTSYGEAPNSVESFDSALKYIMDGNENIKVENDSVGGWAAAMGGKPGINIASGTGAIAYGRDENKNGVRTAGWSIFFSDEGSCSWISRKLIAEYIKQTDGRHPKTIIYDAIKKNFPTEEDLFLAEYFEKVLVGNPSKLASMQRIALDCAENGDKVAIGFYDEAAKELTEMAIACRNRLSFQNERVDVSYTGGLFRTGKMILDPLRNHLEQNNFVLHKPEHPSMIGPITLAAENYIPATKMAIFLDNLERQINL